MTTMFISESDLAQQINVSREKIAAFRATLFDGEDWLKNGRRIMFTAEGAAKACEHFLGAAAKLPQPSELDPVAMTVEKVPLNKHNLIASAGGRTVIVRVRNNANFKPGMSIRAVPISGDLYQLHGRAPRYHGAW